MKKIKMSVSGIMCNNCVKKVNASIAATTGCVGSTVSDDYSTVFVDFIEDQISAGQIADIIESIKEKSFQVIKTEEI